MIITDGIINDMERTIDKIVEGSGLPMAVVIIGVGNAEFDNMDRLDGDDEALFSTYQNKYAQADIVQFVPFDEFKNDPT